MPAHALPLAITLGLGLGAGVLIGLAHFAGLARNVRLFSSGRLGIGFLLLATRLLLTAALLTLLARAGYLAVLSGLAGVLLARQIVLRGRDRPDGPEGTR